MWTDRRTGQERIILLIALYILFMYVSELILLQIKPYVIYLFEIALNFVIVLYAGTNPISGQDHHVVFIDDFG